MTIFYSPFLAQLPDPTQDSLIRILSDAGAITVLAIAIIFLAYSQLQQSRNKGRDEDAENKRLEKLIDNIAGMVTGFMEDRQHNRKVIESNSETQRLVTTAINENTGSQRQMNTTMEGLARDFKAYQTLNTDTVSGFRLDLDAFKTEVISHVQQLMAISEANANYHQSADKDRVEIKAMLGEIITLVNNIKPPQLVLPPPPQVIEANVTFTPPTASDVGSEAA